MSKIEPIYTENLVLREFTLKDVEEVHEYACDNFVTQYMTWGPNTLEQTRAFLSERIADQDSDHRLIYGFAVTLKSQRRVIGGCRVRKHESDPKTGELGYVLNPNYWGKGYGTELGKALLKFGFEDLGLDNIRGLCDVRNEPSKRLMNAIGLKQESDTPEPMTIKGVERDVFTFSISREEWLGK